MNGIARDVQQALYASLMGGDGDARERCREYLQESPSVSQERSELEARLKRLRRAKQE